jgi:hypothetical protein
VAEYVETRRRMYCAGHGAGVDGVDYTKCGFEVAVRDASLCALGDEVEDSGSGCLRTGSCGCGHSNEREKFVWDGKTLSEWCVDEVEEVSLC